MSFKLNAENQKKLELLFKRYPHKKALTLPLLWLIQFQESFLSEESMEFCATTLDVPFMHVYSVATFYTMFKLKKPPKHTIEVCRTLSCELNGSEELKAFIEEHKSEDIELLEVECMGACSGAPMCTINGKYHENISLEEMSKLLKELR